MNDTIANLIAEGVDLMIAAVMLVSITAVMSVFMVFNTSVVENQALSAEIQEYRVHNAYENKHVYAQDIVSIIFKSRGYPAVSVQSSKGNHTWSRVSVPCDYKTGEITKLIDQTVIYDSQVVRSVNGEVLRYELKPHTNGCGCN